jgi:hypothetical protein
MGYAIAVVVLAVVGFGIYKFVNQKTPPVPGAGGGAGGGDKPPTQAQ